MLDPKTALDQLKQGNLRFANDTSRNLVRPPVQMADPAGDQRPFAAVLGCADSRVPVETVFDQGVGDLFVVRVAGNVATSAQTGSVEFAVAQFDTRLIVVLGHNHCGAVKAALAEARQPSDNMSPNLRDVVDQILPGVSALATPEPATPEVVDAAVEANVRASVQHLLEGSSLLQAQVKSGNVAIVGAVYELETGLIRFLSDK